MASVDLSYYYGYEAEQFSFYRIPKRLFTDRRFATISTDAKLLYGILLDRMSLSMKNGWHDDQGRVYIIFTLEDVAETLGYKTEKAIKLFNELDTKKGVGLIERVRQGQGRASLIYVKNFAGERQTSTKPKSRPRKNRGQDFGYTQCFQELYRVADEKYNGKLPIPVRVIQDEWANVAQPDSYPKILATCRSYNVSLNIIVQNIAQIKNIYEKEWESIIGNCDTLLFLGGGNEPTSLEFMSKLLGKETLDTRTRGLTRGHSGSSSTNYQQAGRELMMQEEIRLMDTDDSILLIRGERPVLDKKYDLIKHPNIKLTEDGGAAPYVHKSLPTKFEVSDLPYDFRSLDDYQFDTMEEFDHENPDEDEEE